jgi:drug/metabolite transporter (DMT)-like permease
MSPTSRLAKLSTRVRRPAGSASSSSFDRLDARAAAVAGAVGIGLVGPLVDVSGASAATASFYRALFAAALLAAMRGIARCGASCRGAWRLPRRSVAQRITAYLAGVFLGLDMVLWTVSIHAVGPGIATVLVNVQVVVVPLASLVAFGERVRRSFWLLAPVLLAGVGLAGGVLGGHAGAATPWYGTLMGAAAGTAYSGYLLLLRRTSAEPEHRLTYLTDAMSAAAAVAAVAGLVTGRLDLTPGWGALAWLLLVAVAGQILAWLLLGSALPRLAASTGSVLLLIQPIVALGVSAALLGERPAPLQLAGAAVVLAAVVLLSRRERRPNQCTRRPGQPPEAGATPKTASRRGRRH